MTESKNKLYKILEKASKTKLLELISFKVLNERGVYDDYTLNWSIGCWDKPEYNYSINDAYFKVFDSTDIKRAKKCARITLLNPRYIIHNGKNADRSKKPWSLSSTELKELDRIMRLNFRGESVWKLAML